VPAQGEVEEKSATSFAQSGQEVHPNDLPLIFFKTNFALYKGF
jgi:hypothetical protein